MSSLLHTARAVAWSFIGIRKASESHNDMTRLNPLHIVLVAFAAVVVMVAGLVGLVHWVVR